MSTAVPGRGLPPGPRDVLDALPYGVLLLDPDGAVTDANPRAHELLPDLAADATRRCHEVLGCQVSDGPCERGCLRERATHSGEASAEIRIDPASDGQTRPLWLTFAPLDGRRGAIVHIRPGEIGDRRWRNELRRGASLELEIRAFGRTQVQARGQSLGGTWLAQRPGQVLKYLVSTRDRVAMADEIAESIWPGQGRRAVGNTRHVMHRLRDKLEPLRSPHTGSSFVLAVGGGYTLDRERIWIDVDEFEQSVEQGSAAMNRLEPAAAAAHLEHAMGLYRDEFLRDEPYAHWAHDERSRLGGLAGYALRVLVVLDREREDHGSAVRHLKRLADIEPLDSDISRELISALLFTGQRSEAKRRYAGFADRLRREFGEDPDFDLRSLASSSGGQASRRA
ncbi:MAG TPA: BTAD domain-containing putative transcriptional regulator [Solirubrobacteraceae bacterium]|nr:BTAD domain-containing putative transcriptional regulator [Solirubrobacteraceae bacterium]